VEKEFQLAIAKGIATKHNFNSQGAQSKATKENVNDENLMAAWKTSSLIV
jgi:hypothetical protein